MTSFIHKFARVPVRLAIVGSLALLVAGCASPDPAVTRGAPFDPYEAENRRMHDFNRDLDRSIVRPVSNGYSAFVADDIETVVSNFATNLSIPGAIVNNVLQGNGKGASEDFYRFLVNTTIGLGGLFDTATELKMPARTNADFGQTLYVWGVNEGPYVELPLLGPSTTRDAVGRTVDLFTNPLDYAFGTPDTYYGTGAKISSGMTSRSRYGQTIDQLLYESADSYAAAQSLYLQNRRFKVGRSGSDAYLDPYDAGASVSTALSDPYEDPYNE